MRTRGFTLLEVLGIVPIIVLLVGVGQGLALKPGDKANEVGCLSHLQQLGIAFQMYRQDWGDALPWWSNPNNTAPLPAPFTGDRNVSWTWDVSISPYVTDLYTFHCPWQASSPTLRYPIRSYALPRNISGMPFAAAPLPQKTVLLFEKGAWPMGSLSDSPGEWFAQSLSGSGNPVAQYPNNPERWGRHHGLGNNFLFLDGHTSWVQELVFSTPNSDNPYGYSFGNSPAQGIFQYGYCGDKTTLNGSATANEWGANLPH